MSAHDGGTARRRSAPRSVEEALERAATHARRAAAEAVETVHALLDAVALGTTGRPAGEHAALATASQLLEDLARAICGASAQNANAAAGLGETLAAALDAEIARWEQHARRSPADGEARAVLRAFLGLREALWEIGVRRHEPAAGNARAARAHAEREGGHAASASGAAAGRAASRRERPGPRASRPRDPGNAAAPAAPRVQRVRVES